MQLRPRSFYYRLPKKAIRAATKMALASRLIDGQVVVIDRLEMTAPKTRELATVLKALGLAGQSTLVATEAHAPNVYMSGRNIPGLTVSPVADLNALAIMRPRKVLLTKAAVELIKSKSENQTAA
jgi:large subunit ribosomal protein L4